MASEFEKNFTTCILLTIIVCKESKVQMDTNKKFGPRLRNKTAQLN